MKSISKVKNKWLYSIRLTALFVILVNLLFLIPAIRKIILNTNSLAQFSLLKSFVVSPIGAYQDFLFMPPVYYLTAVFTSITLCVFILFKSNIARILFVFLQCFLVVFGLIVMVLFLLISQNKIYWIFDTFIRICLFPLLYCVFFMLPKVREQFNSRQQGRLRA